MERLTYGYILHKPQPNETKRDCREHAAPDDTRADVADNHAGAGGRAAEIARRSTVAHLRWLGANRIALTEAMLPGFVFAFMEAKSFPPSGRRAAVANEEATETIFTAVLEEGMDTGRFRIEDPAFAAALIKPLLRDWYVKRAKWHRRGIKDNAYAARIPTFIEQALKACRNLSNSLLTL